MFIGIDILYGRVYNNCSENLLEVKAVEFGWIWVAIIALALILEVVTKQILSVLFIPGAVICTVMDILNVEIIWQALVFLVISAVGILFVRKHLLKLKADKSSKTNIDAIIGEKCVVTERIDNFAGCGQGKVKGQLWSARGLGEDDVFEKGEVLRIVAIEGVKIICKKD